MYGLVAPSPTTFPNNFAGTTNMGIFDWKHWVVILIVVTLVFGTKKLKNLGSDLGETIKGFRKAMNEEESQSSVQPRESQQELQNSQRTTHNSQLTPRQARMNNWSRETDVGRLWHYTESHQVPYLNAVRNRHSRSLVHPVRVRATVGASLVFNDLKLPS